MHARVLAGPGQTQAEFKPVGSVVAGNNQGKMLMMEVKGKYI